MKNSKFKNWPGIFFLAMVIAILSGCDMKKKSSEADVSKIDSSLTDSLLAMPEGLVEISDSTAEVLIKTYHDSTTERNFGQGLPFQVGNYLLKKFKTDIVLSLAKKDTNIFTIYVLPINNSGTITYKFFTEGKNFDASYNTVYQQIPVCKPLSCPCRYYPPPCNN